jgi:two-component system response regulator
VTKGQGAVPVSILLVEDNPGDVRLLREAFREARVGSMLYRVEDGVEALAFLRRQGKHRAAPRPDLILLDLNLPRKDGREVLTEIKLDDDLKGIPVVVLTSSPEEQDLLRTYSLGANYYLTKPVGLDQLAEVIRAIQAFWQTFVPGPSE